MTRCALLLSPLLLGGCFIFGANDDSGDPGQSCGLEAASVSPADGATDVFIDADYEVVEVTFPVDDATLVVRLAGSEDALPGEVDVDGRTHRWTINGSLGTEREVEVYGRVGECEELLSTFTTGPWTYQDLGGRVYGIDLEGAEGEGAGGLQAVLDTAGIQLVFWASDTETSTWTLLGAQDGVQDTCVPTTEIRGDFANSLLVLQVDEGMIVPEADMRLLDTEVLALVPEGGATWDRVRLRGELDVTWMEDCSILTAFNATCGPCSGGQGQCMRFDISGAAAVELGFSPVSSDGC